MGEILSPNDGKRHSSKKRRGLSLSDERGFFLLNEQRVSERIGRDDGFDERICRARVACQDGGSLSEIRVDV